VLDKKKPNMKVQLNKKNKKNLCDPFICGLVSRVLNESGQKSTRIKICKKISTQSDPNPW